MLAFLIGHLCGESCLILHQPDSGSCTFTYRLSVPLLGINETLHVPSQLQMDRKRLKCQNLCKSGSLMSSELPFFTWLPTIYYLFNMWDNCPALSVVAAVFSSARYEALHHLIVARRLWQSSAALLRWWSLVQDKPYVPWLSLHHTACSLFVLCGTWQQHMSVNVAAVKVSLVRRLIISRIKGPMWNI